MKGTAPILPDPIQTGGRSDVFLPASFVGGFLRAVEEVFGATSLHVLLDGLEAGGRKSRSTGDAGALRGGMRGGMRAADFAALQHSIRDYYGTGARGGLNQAGRRTWRSMLDSAPLSQRLGMLSLRLLTPVERKRKGLEYLTNWLSLPDRPITVRDCDAGLQIRDPFGPTTVGQASEEPLCWVMVGLIQEAVLWACGEDADVIETACRAQGAAACLFLIRE